MESLFLGVRIPFYAEVIGILFMLLHMEYSGCDRDVQYMTSWLKRLVTLTDFVLGGFTCICALVGVIALLMQLCNLQWDLLEVVVLSCTSIVTYMIYIHIVSIVVLFITVIGLFMVLALILSLLSCFCVTR